MSTTQPYSRPIPLLAIVLLALVVHGPLLLMQLPAGSFDTNFHIFFASHYAHHWFDPWNEKWFAGFSQTTYPPLTHQWIALLSNVVGLKMGYMLVQLIAVLAAAGGSISFCQNLGGRARRQLCCARQRISGGACLSRLPGRTACDGCFGGSLFECAALLLRMDDRGRGTVFHQGSRDQPDGCGCPSRHVDFRRAVLCRAGALDGLPGCPRRARYGISRPRDCAGRGICGRGWRRRWHGSACLIGWRSFSTRFTRSRFLTTAAPIFC